MSSKWKEIVGSVAPALATALGGPLAGAAVKTIATQVLGKTDATEKDVEQAIVAGDSQTLLKLREVDGEFKKAMLDAGVNLEKIAAEDRANARKREADTHDSATPRILAAVVVGGFFYCVVTVVSGNLPSLKDPVIAGLVGTVLGYASAKADQVVSYYFGSSSSSRSKDKAISDIAKMP